MYKYLFFDDQKLYLRSGLNREYGVPELIADSVYYDGYSSTDLRNPFVFLCDDGKFRMIYAGNLELQKSLHCFVAVSDDGIHFQPEDVSKSVPLKDRICPHELFRIPSGEIAEVVEDRFCDPSERYKMLFCETDYEKRKVHGIVLSSPDLIHWSKIDGDEWGGAEPITGVLYHSERGCFTVLVRPDWSERRVGYVDTKDFRKFSPYELCLQVDSLDQPLDELYGMPVTEYGGCYIGFPLFYRGFSAEKSTKYLGGTITAQLAYSWDGHHWQRSLRSSFLSGDREEYTRIFGYENYMCWPSSFRVDRNGDLIIYAAVSGKPHGTAFEEPGKGRLCVFCVKKDRLIGLCTADCSTGIISTRENIWHSGEVQINLCCQNATVAVFETIGDDILGISHPIAGYSHEDCVPFTGDSVEWVPQFKNGKCLNDLAGKTIVIEVRMENGKLYSITGDCTPVMNLQAARYRKFGILPQKRKY